MSPTLKLHIPWWSSRGTSPGAHTGRRRAGNPGSIDSLPGVVPTVGEAGVGTQPFQNAEGMSSAPKPIKTPVPARRSLSAASSPPHNHPPGVLVELHHIETHENTISSVQFLPDGKHIVTSNTDGLVRKWKIDQSSDQDTSKVTLSGGTSPVIVSRDDKWIVLVGTEGRKVAVLDAKTHEKVAESIDAHDRRITALDVSRNASIIASGSRDGAVIIWCLETAKRLVGPFKQGPSIISLRFSPTGDHIASVAWDYSIRVWNLWNNNDQSVVCIPTDPANSLAWAHDTLLFAGCYGGSILSLDSSGSTPATKWPHRPHADSITTLRVSNNGKFVVSASNSERSIRIWDVHTRSEIGSLQHSAEIHDAEISADDSCLVSGMKDGRLSVWDLRKVLPTSYFCYSLTTCVSSFPVDSYPVFTEVNNAAYLSWKRADLARAEEILSCEIEPSSSHVYYHLANRALIRARLRQWDGALDDAQTSYLVKPSLVALIAKSIAQSGKGWHQAATETLDTALETCDREEQDLVGVIKAIKLFDAGYRDEGLHHVRNLVVGSAHATQRCVYVQTKMYALLAADAMNSQEFTKAISLLQQARSLCPSTQCPEMDIITLVSGWVFGSSRLAVYQQLCMTFEAAERTQDVLSTIREMEEIFKNEIQLRNEVSQWITGFKCRCVGALELQGDRAMQNEDYGSAIAQYSTALTLNSLRVSLFVKRSEARTALSLWEVALKDADEAIRLNPSSPWGYERQHAALHGLKRYEDAIRALTAMISSLEGSTELEIQRLRGNYISPGETTEAIFKVFTDCVRNSPFRLIDTISGHLCDAERRREIFKQDPVFQELVSSMTTQLHRERIETVTRRYFRFAMLSHRWEAQELVLGDVCDKSIYALGTSPSATKLQQFCRLARDAQFRWAWSDTCCINKEKDVEFEKSINSMFHWYRCSSTTIVYLTGVPPLMIPGALGKSIWMTRGWTLQEFLAPPVIRFYYEDWTPYLNNTSLNHKESADIVQEIEDATGVPVHDLIAFRPGPEDIRLKLRLASTREMTVPVDMAYGLFGIFGVTMPVIHGETQQNALGRLFQKIVARSGDAECLAWVGRSSEFNSAFPSHIRVYEHLSATVPCIEEGELGRCAAEMRRAWTHEQEEQAVRFYQGLEMFPHAHCVNQHLYLPCIVFRVTMLERTKRTDDGVRRAYRASTDALEDTEIHTDERLSLKIQAQGAEEFVLVCPWIHELLDTVPNDRGRHHSTSGKAESPSDSGSESEGRTSVMRNRSHPSPSSSTATDETLLMASRLVVRLRQPLGALLLLAQGRRQFKRVATDHEITIRIRKGISLADMDLRPLQII